ncbi:alanine/ornithine racemase family PLP-dependent enzyme [Marinobacterium marinum]|uniref:alanine/ornithine racemase family PLP-dependent enzyme n=1 Tax=Marinobacterium marinum TaxID=2756129 RepID=UPI002E21CA8D
MIKFPRLLWSESKLRSNIRFLNRLFATAGAPMNWTPVSKAVCANPEIVGLLLDEGVTEIADSRIENLKRIKSLSSHCSTLLLRLPGLHEVDEVVRYADTSLVSEATTIERLSAAARDAQVRHRIILMVELGDLREGVLPQQVLALGRFILQQPNIDWCGIGTNLTCYGGILPTREKMLQLLAIKTRIADELGHVLDVVSGGNSSSLPLLLRGDMPTGVSHLRLGESLLLGRETVRGQTIAGMYDDIFRLEAEVIEVRVKSSVPEGERGMDAFGKVPEFEDVGEHRRAILAIGRQDVPIDELVPLEAGIRILGGSSDHMILDVGKNPVKIGDILTFGVNYPVLLQAMTSPYVAKVRV